jgi:hypothetical protein
MRSSVVCSSRCDSARTCGTLAGKPGAKAQPLNNGTIYFALGLHAQKKSVSASERNEDARAQWREKAGQWNPSDLVFLDESGCNTSLHRTHGRAPRGQRLAASVPRNWKENTTIIGALSLESWQALTLPGAADRLAFEAFVEKVLVPSLRPGQIVILDNLNTHKSAFAQHLVEQERLCAALGRRGRLLLGVFAALQPGLESH